MNPISGCGEMTMTTRGVGRPTLFTAELQTKILNALKGGSTRAVAVASAGIDYSTFCLWQKRANREKQGEYFEFFQAVRQAEADSAIRNVAIIQKSAMGGEVIQRTTVTRPDGSIETVEKRAQPDWRAATWWLERKFPQEWGPVERVEHSAPGGGPIKHEHEHVIIIEDRVGRPINRGRFIEIEPEVTIERSGSEE